MGLHKSIKLSFLTVGHTKFSPDWCFGLLKQRFRRTKVDCLDDIVRVVESSAAINHAQLVGTQSGETVVPTFKWADFLSSFLKRVPHIKRLHHFQFTSEDLGTSHCKKKLWWWRRKVRPHKFSTICGGLPWTSSSKRIEWCSSVVLVSKDPGILFGWNEGQSVSPTILPPNICHFFVSTSPAVNHHFSSKIFNFCNCTCEQADRLAKDFT